MAPKSNSKPHRITLATAHQLISPNSPFAEVFRDGSSISIEYYAPDAVDNQTPHDRDELYIVATGYGRFILESDTFEFSAGDLIYVPAHAVHRFVSFSEDFGVWVIFYGPAK